MTDEWHVQKSRRNKNKNVNIIKTQDNSSADLIRTLNPIINNSELLPETYVQNPGNISFWATYMLIGDIENLVNEKLANMDLEVQGNINNLQDILFHQFKDHCNYQKFTDSYQLKQYIYGIVNETEQGIFINNQEMKLLSEEMGCKIIFHSIDIRLKDVIYGAYILKSFFHILHIGFNHFLSLFAKKNNNKYTFTSEDRKKIVESISTENKLKTNKSILKNEVSLLQSIRSFLRGKEKYEEYIKEEQGSKKFYVYDLYSHKEISRMENIILCKLNLSSAHSGVAIPLKRTDFIKYPQIQLTSRRNCGYNAFENDIVHVKINVDKDGAYYTGKVVGVFKSNHKPVNNIYICKVSKDQGSLMSPLDKSFPKIHVDNQPGRRLFESDMMKSQKSNRLSQEQMTAADRERNSAKFADNMYYSVFEISFQQFQDKPSFNLKKIESFNPETCEKLFIVFFEYWDPSFIYPFGKIVGTLSSGESLTENFHLISSVCQIEPLDINSSYEEEIKEIGRKSNSLEYFSDTYLPSGAVIFTIDNETTTDMDDAISYHKENSDSIIGIHISDVTKYISSTHEIYRQALRRFCTYYPPKFSDIPPIHLLHDKLSTDILSLVPDKPRAVVSVFFRFEEEKLNFNFRLSDIIYPTFKEGVIVSKYKLNYDQVSFWLRQSENPEDVEKDLYIALTETYKVAKFIRRARLPESYFVRQLNDYHKDFKIDNKFEAEILIEEFMILANEYVAREIYKKYPNLTLLRVQDPVIGYENWLEGLYQYTNMNFASLLKDYCNLNAKENSNDDQTRRDLVVSKSFYDEFCKYLNDDLDKAKCLLQNDFLISDFYMHITKWYELSNPSHYQCSKNGANNKNFYLNKDLYTHFTSPIRRFTDIVVHLFLKSIINNYEIMYDSQMIDDICVMGNTKAKNIKKIKELCSSYAVLEETDKKYCFVLDCVCIEINDNEICIAHPLLEKITSEKVIKFSNLSLENCPLLQKDPIKLGNTSGTCTLKWRKIIYSYPPFKINPSNVNKFTIDNHLYECHLPHSCHKIFSEVRQSYQSGEELKDQLCLIKSYFKRSNNENIIISSDRNSFTDPFINIELTLFIKNITRIQFCKFFSNGLQEINPELLIITETLQICLSHQKDPVKYFVLGGKLQLKHNIIKKRFKNIKEYQEYFEDLIRIETLAEILSEKVAFTLLNVPVTWIVSDSLFTKGKQRYGIIFLSLQFCMSRNIFTTDEHFEIFERYEYLVEKGISSVGGDLLCLRYKKDNWNNYWVGHGQVVNIGFTKKDNETYKVIIFLLTHSDFDSFFNNSKDTYTIDVYLKSIVSKRQEKVIRKIDNHLFLQDIVLGSILKENTNTEILNETQIELKSDKIFQCNLEQEEAVMNSLRKGFSLIIGPPGTGKTHVGCILSYAFTFIKTIKNERGVLVYCAPSNDAVNLVANEMRIKFQNKCPKLLRIFGKEQELTDYPIPGGYFAKKEKIPLSEELREISLHCLIRTDNSDFAYKLKKFDEAFKTMGEFKREHSSDEALRRKCHEYSTEYQTILKEAKINYITNNKIDIVLCTVSVSGTWIMDHFNITQIIIDEAGMCKEPETLIPIYTAINTPKKVKNLKNIKKHPENIVLIGDHKQLRPIIHSKIANKYGLKISLFERYSKIRPENVTQLKVQYRMHPSICEFPSNEFYNGSLKTQISPLWSGLLPQDMKSNVNYNEWNGIDYTKVEGNCKVKLKKSNYDAIPNEMWPKRRCKPYSCFNRQFDYYPERLIFINVIGDEIIQSVSSLTGNEKSRGNKMEVKKAAFIYEKLISKLNPKGEAHKFVTVLTQYRLQQNLLKEKCKEILKAKNIEIDPIVNTVIRSQGSENDYVIFSTVRSLKNTEEICENQPVGWEKRYLGFITDTNQINVALTRARKGLIIIGNKNLLRVNKVWRNLIDDLNDRGCVVESNWEF